MNQSYKTWWLFLVGVVLVFAGVLNGDVSAQAGEGRVVLIQEDNEGTQIITSMTEEATLTITLPAEQCTQPSPNLTYMASSDRTDPDYVEVYSLEEGILILQIPWQPTWTQPCEMFWFDTNLLAVWHGSDSTEWDQIDLKTGAISSYAYTPPLLPNKYPGSFDAVPSPSGQEYVYERCFGDIVPWGESWTCDGSVSSVIYNVEQQEVVTRLKNVYEPSRPLASEIFLAWSPSGRYFAYWNWELVTIYDRQQDSYIDFNIVDDYPYSVSTRPYGMLFSPDETKLALWGDDNSENYTYGMILVDIENNRVEFHPTPKEHLPGHLNGWAWTFDSQHILVQRPNGDLADIEVTTGTEQLVAEDVTRIRSWYPNN